MVRRLSPLKAGLTALAVLLVALTGCDNPVLDLVKNKVDIFSGNVPDISVKFEGITVRNGDTLPPLVYTNLGSSKSLNFTIENLGKVDLHLSETQAIAIEPGGDYALEQGNEPDAVVPPAENTSFLITFEPATVGTRLALLTIICDDPDEEAYQIMLSGTATETPEPEIQVTQDTTELTSGTSLYEFGNVIADGLTGYSATTVFTITNIGTAQLLIGGVTMSGAAELDYTLNDTSISPLAVGSSTNFSVEFDPLSTADGKPVDISIASDDADESTFSFSITGNGAQWIGPSTWASNRTYGDRIEVGWGPQPYAERYDVYRATSWSGTYTKIAEAAGTGFTDTIDTAGYPCLLDQGYIYKIKGVRLLATTPVTSELGAGAYGQRTGYYHFLGAWGGYGVGDGQFARASGVDYDSSGNFYVCQEGSSPDYSYTHRVQKFDSSGSYLTKWGSKGSGDGQFLYAMGIAVGSISSVDHVYVADTGNHRIQRFSTGGAFEGWLGYDGTSTGWHAPGSGKTGAAGTINGAFDSPMDVDCYGNFLFVSDTGNDRLQIFTLDGNSFVRSVGSHGSGEQQFDSPHGIAADINFVYVADTNNHRIQKVHWNVGTVITRWGSQGSADGEFSSPRGVGLSTDSDYLYVSETGNARIQKFENPSPTSYVPSAFVNKFGTYGVGSDDFYTVVDLVIGVDETLYICEYYNNYIELFRWE